MKKTYQKIGSAALAIGMVIPTFTTNISHVSAHESKKVELENEKAELQLPPAKNGYQYISSVQKVETDKNKVTLTLQQGERLRFTFLDQNVFRMYMAPKGKDFLETPTPNSPDHKATITAKSDQKYYDQYKITPTISREEGIKTIIKTGKLTIEIDEKTSMMTVKNASGNVVIKESAPLQYKEGSTIQTLVTDPSEYFYGGGTQNGRFSHKGELINIVNSNNWVDKGVASPNPFYWSTKGYGVVRNTWKPGAYDFRDKDFITTTHNEKRFDAYFFVEDTPKNILNEYYELTGSPTQLPEYAFYLGHLNCYNRDYWKEVEANTPGAIKLGDKWYVESQNNNGGKKETLNGTSDFTAESIINEYKKYDMPLGWFLPNDGYGCGYGQSNTQAANIENLKTFAKNAIGKGVQTGLWTQSNLWPQDPNNPGAQERDIYKEVEAGVNAVKTDVAWVGSGYSMALNGISVAYDAIQKKSTLKPNIVTLDGWAGTQRYGGIWTGDQTGGLWEYIRFHIPTYIGTSLSGQPNMGSDMDGIFGGKNQTVWTRDFQWKAFTPYMLDMDGWGSNQKTPWALGEDGTSINRAYLKLKAQLMPYINTISYEATQKAGLPMIRAMFLEEANPYTLGKATQYQYMWGNQFLVAPIYQETKIDAKGNDIRNNIYLPSNTEVWVDYFTGKQYRGGQVLNNFDAPIWKLPVFVKNGSIIPMYAENNNPEPTTATNTDGLDRSKRIVEFYPYGNTEFVAYEDDGKTLGGKSITTKYTSKVENGNAILTAEKTNGNYEGMVSDRTTEFIVNVSKAPEKVVRKVNGKEVEFKKVNTLDEYNKANENVYFYDEAPATIVKQYANKNSSFQQMEEKTSPKVRVKSTQKENITTNEFQIIVKGFENKQDLGANTINETLQVPQNIKTSDITSSQIRLNWDQVENASTYDVMVDGTLYRNIKDTHYIHEGLDFLSEHNYQVRSVNEKGEFSKWSDVVKETTADNPYRNVPKPEHITWTGTLYGNHSVDLAFDQQFQSGDGGFHSGSGAIGKELIVDFGKYYDFDKLEYFPRDDAGNGTVSKMDIAVSLDGKHWTDIGTQTWELNSQKKEVSLHGKRGRYIKLVPKEARGGFFSASEILIYKKDKTEGYLVGDVNSSGAYDEGDLTFYQNYTGLKKEDNDWSYIDAKAGDIDGNGIVDAYDFSYVTTKLNGGISSPSQNVEGKIQLIPTKTDIKAGEKVNVDVYGIGLKNVNAFSVEIPISSQFTMEPAKASVMTAFMSNYSKNRVHSDHKEDNYVLFTNIGNQKLLDGTGKLATLTLTAKQDFNWDTKITQALVVGQDLSKVDAKIDENQEPTLPQTTNRLSKNQVNFQFSNKTGENINANKLFQQENWKDILFDGNTNGDLAEFKWDLSSNPVPSECILPTNFIMDVANNGKARKIKKITIHGRNNGNGKVKKSKLSYIDANGKTHELAESTQSSPTWEINENVKTIIWTPIETDGIASTQPEGQKANRMLSIHEIVVEEDATVLAEKIQFAEGTKTDIKVGHLQEVSAIISPSNVSNPLYEITSSDETILKVNTIATATDYKYFVQGLKEGKATLTATTQDKKLKATIEITVTAGADISTLEQEIAKVEKMHANLYTIDSWANVQKVVEEAKQLLQKEPTQEQVDEITTKLMKVVSQLKLKGSNDNQPSSSHKIDSSTMKIADVTSTADQDYAQNAIDGNPNTIWHSSYQEDASLPQHITVDLGRLYQVEQVNYLPRQGRRNGHITHYRIETSVDNQVFVPVVEGYLEQEDGALKDPGEFKEIKFDATKARYVRFIALNTLGDTDNKYASCAELNIFGEKEKETAYEKLQNEMQNIQQLDARIYTKSSWEELQVKLAEAKKVNPDTPEEKITFITNELKFAQVALDVKADSIARTILSEKITSVESLLKTHPNSETLQNLVKAAKKLLENEGNNASKAQVLEAMISMSKEVLKIENLEADKGQENLDILVKYTKNHLLANAQDLTKEEIKALQAIIDKISPQGTRVRRNAEENPSFENTSMLIVELEKVSNRFAKNELLNLTQMAKSIENDGYTKQTWDNLQQVIKQMEDVLAKPAVAKEELDVSIVKIKNAIQQLKQEIHLQIEALQQTITLAEKILADADHYAKDSIKDLPKALEDAKKALNNAKTQDEIDHANTKLKAVVEKAYRKVERSKLKQMIVQGESYDLSKYTKESAQNLRSAIQNAKDIFQDDYATQQQIEDATKAIQLAIQGLKINKEDSSQPGIKPNQPESGGSQNGNHSNSTVGGAETAYDDALSRYGIFSILSIAGLSLLAYKKKGENKTK